MKPYENVILEVARERERQIAVEGWTPEHDDTHKWGEMAHAAAAYAAHTEQGGQADLFAGRASGDRVRIGRFCWHLVLWPWSDASWKPTTRRRDLVKAAALIVAEIERLDRARRSASEGS